MFWSRRKKRKRRMDDSGRILILPCASFNLSFIQTFFVKLSRPWKNPFVLIFTEKNIRTNSFFVAGILFHNFSQIAFCFNIIKKLYPLASDEIKVVTFKFFSRQFCLKFLINLLWKEKRGLFVGLNSLSEMSAASGVNYFGGGFKQFWFYNSNTSSHLTLKKTHRQVLYF